jgi:hypothetical protein
MKDILELARECGGTISGFRTWEDDELVHLQGAHMTAAALTAFAARIREEAMEEAAKQVPTSWLDPLLTGPGGMGRPPYRGHDIERLLRRIAAAIRLLAQQGAAK